MASPPGSRTCPSRACSPTTWAAKATPAAAGQPAPRHRLVRRLPRDADAALPERHLGILQAAEIADLDARLDRLADHLARTGAADRRWRWPFPTPSAPVRRCWQGRRIAIARDAAFGFIYPANLDTLRPWAPSWLLLALAGEPLPACDALWLPGGYPELHAARWPPTPAGRPG
jgi:cobyrinic acid a,c-diamide synthase